MSHTGFTGMIGTRRSSLASIFSFSPFCIGAEPPGRPPHLAPAHWESLPIHLPLEMRYPTPFSIHFQSRHTRSNTGTGSEPEGYPASWPGIAAWQRGGLPTPHVGNQPKRIHESHCRNPPHLCKPSRNNDIRLDHVQNTCLNQFPVCTTSCK